MGSASRSVVVIGGGFAGVWAALAAARRRRELAAEHVDVTLVSDRMSFGIRPRYYEADRSGDRIELRGLLEPAGVGVVHDAVVSLDARSGRIGLRSGHVVSADVTVLAAGSAAVTPPFPGGASLFSIDTPEEADRLDDHLRSACASATAGVHVVVAGGGFTGIEAAAEMPTRLARLCGSRTGWSVTLVERNERIADGFGSAARAEIEGALGKLGVRVMCGVSIASVSDTAVELSNGTTLPAAATVWTAGVQASALTRSLEVATDDRGRVPVDRFLRVRRHSTLFAAGDVAAAKVDESFVSEMSCQHAIPQGKVAGHNAVSTLNGGELLAYRQDLYVTSLDLGDAGAVLTEGHARERLVAHGEEGKAFKRYLNRSLIYPPMTGDVDELLAAAIPETSTPQSASATAAALADTDMRSAVIAASVDGAAVASEAAAR